MDVTYSSESSISPLFTRRSLSSSATSLSSSTDHTWRWSSSALDVTHVREVRQLWNNRQYQHVWDVDFMNDGSVVYIVCRKAVQEGWATSLADKQLCAVDMMGKPVSLPFSYRFNDPRGVAVCRQTGTVAVADSHCDTCDCDESRSHDHCDHVDNGVGSHKQGKVTIIKTGGNEWRCKTHQTHSATFRIALTNTDLVACAIRWEKLEKVKVTNQGHEVIWKKSISSSNDLVPYIAVDPEGKIIVSTPSSNRVSVYNQDGSILAVFPTWFLHRPTGVTVGSTGKVYVADIESRSVCQFDIKGRFIQKIVKVEFEPRSISLYEDKYLVIGTYNEGIYMYELEWE